jgi:Domain of unknown function (DUF4373)
MKEAYYFSHDYNARSDEKIKLLIRKHGMAGYGIFWAIVEDLYNNANALRLDCDGIAYDLRTDSELVKSVINDFGLFVFEGECFGSLSVQDRLNLRGKKSAKAAQSAYARWGKNANALENDANALRTECESNAIKERKGKDIKEIKESKEISPAQFPTRETSFTLNGTEIQDAKEIYHRATGQLPTDKDIGNFMAIFVNINFTGQKFYENRTEIVKHFKNWVKSQKLQNGKSNHQSAIHLQSKSHEGDYL